MKRFYLKKISVEVSYSNNLIYKSNLKYIKNIK